MQFRLWIENQSAYYWASDQEVPPGTVLVAGVHPDKEYNPWATAFNGVIEKHRATHYPGVPSRSGAFFLSDSLALGRRWQRSLRKPYLYEVEVLGGRLHRTDSNYWGDAEHDFSKWGLYRNVPVDKTVAAYDSGEHGYTNWIKDKMNQYWKAEKDEDSDFEYPEIILEKGGQVRILRAV